MVLDAVVQDPLPKILTTRSKVNLLERNATARTVEVVANAFLPLSLSRCTVKSGSDSVFLASTLIVEIACLSSSVLRLAARAWPALNSDAHHCPGDTLWSVCMQWEEEDDIEQSQPNSSPSASRHVRLPRANAEKTFSPLVAAKTGGNMNAKRRKHRRWTDDEVATLRQEVGV